MRFLIDTNLPPVLAKWLAGQGHEAQHVTELGMEAAQDRAIWQAAANSGAVIVTKDEDFALLKAANSAGPGVVWIRIGNAVRRVLLQRLAAAWPSVIARLEEGHGIVEVR